MENNEQENKNTKILPNKAGKDGRMVYYSEDSPYWGTGAIKCRALIKFCKGALYDSEGKQIGNCNYEFGTDQTETVCPQCGTLRRTCGKPALKETQDWEVPVCRSHAVGLSQYFRDLGAALKDEKQINTIQELMDTDLVPAVEVLQGFIASVVLKQIENKTPDWKTLKAIESLFTVMEKAKKMKENKNEGLEESIRQKVMKEAEPIQLEGLYAGIIHTYKGLPKNIKIERFKALRQENPMVAQQVLLRSNDQDLICFVNSIDTIEGEIIEGEDKK